MKSTASIRFVQVVARHTAAVRVAASLRLVVLIAIIVLGLNP
jgi:hypothetical protein